MPFLRRRGIMASENDMRRHNTPLDAAMSKPPEEPVDAGVDGVVVPSGRNGAVADDALPSHDAPGHSSAVEDDEKDDVVASDRPETPPIQEETAKHRRFSMLRFRNASDPQLSARAKKQAEAPPPLPRRMFTRNTLHSVPSRGLDLGCMRLIALLTKPSL